MFTLTTKSGLRVYLTQPPSQWTESERSFLQPLIDQCKGPLPDQPEQQPSNTNEPQTTPKEKSSLPDGHEYILDLMKKHGAPLTRENFLAWAYGKEGPPEDWGAALEAMLPVEFQMWPLSPVKRRRKS
jgi:hypothetical protein